MSLPMFWGTGFRAAHAGMPMALFNRRGEHRRTARACSLRAQRFGLLPSFQDRRVAHVRQGRGAV